MFNLPQNILVLTKLKQFFRHQHQIIWSYPTEITQIGMTIFTSPNRQGFSKHQHAVVDIHCTSCSSSMVFMEIGVTTARLDLVRFETKDCGVLYFVFVGTSSARSSYVCAGSAITTHCCGSTSSTIFQSQLP